MNNYLLALITLVYTYVAGEYFWKGNYGMGISFLCYAGANIGFIISSTYVPK